MISPIRLTPNMTSEQQATAINETFAQLENENRSKTIKDASGVNRIIIGQLPNGEYGIVVSNAGVDVLTLVEG